MPYHKYVSSINDFPQIDTTNNTITLDAETTYHILE